MDLAVDNKIQSGVDPEGGGCKCSMANNMSWSSQRRGRGRRRRWSMLNVLFICLLILVSAGMVSSGLVLRDVASEKEVENGGSIHGSVVGTAAEQGRTTREFLHTRKVLQRVNMNPVLHRWGPRSLKDVGIPFILGRGHAADDRALHFRKRDVTDFFEAAPEWPEKVSEGGEDSETPAGGLVRPSGLPSKPLESEKTEKVTGSASETGQVKKEQFPELVMLDRAESTSRSDAQPQMDTTEGIIDPKNATSSPDFRNRDPEFDAQPHVLDKNMVAEFSQLTEGVEGEPEVLGTEVSINTDKVEQKPSLGLEYVEEHGTPSPTQSSEEDESPFADPEHAPILVLPSHRSIKVYIYELPSHLNRDFVARDPRVRETMFATEILIHENFEQSAVRTLDPEEADFYFIPVYTAGVLEESGRVIPDTSASTMLEAVTYVAENWQYFNRLRGLDHVVVAPHDYGACFQYRDELASQTKFRMALRYLTVLQTFGVHDHVCYRPGRSVVIPPYIDVKKLRQLDFAPERDPHEKTVLAFFRGLYIDAGNDPSGKVYSRGVRLAIGETFSHHPDFDISDKPSPTYLQDMVKATFCLCPLGWAPWSPRIFESVQIGCIPVIIADDIILPFEKYFNWERIAVRVKEADVPRLEEILKGIPPETVADMQKAMWDPKVRQALIFPEPAEHGDAFEMILNELESKVDRIRKKQAEYARKHGQ